MEIDTNDIKKELSKMSPEEQKNFISDLNEHVDLLKTTLNGHKSEMVTMRDKLKIKKIQKDLS